MPVSPDYARELVQAIRDVYEDATTQIIAAIAEQVAAGVQDEGRADRRLESFLRLIQRLDLIIDELRRGVPGAVERAIAIAYRRGSAVATKDADDAGLPDATAGAVASVGRTDAISRLLSEAMRPHEEAILQIRRQAQDAYERAVSDAVARMLTGSGTRFEAARDAVLDLMRSGIVSFTDKSGRKWDLASYVEMATRTSAGNAMVSGHVDRLVDLDQDLVIVSNAPEECKICRPWESAVVSLSGQTRGKLADGTTIKGSLAEARRDGLFHPNCVVADTKVSAPTGVRASDSRRYKGEVVVIHTALGDELTITPNHPILTTKGWVNAGALNVGDDLVRRDAHVERMDLMGPDDERIEASIGEIHHALREASTVPPVSVPAAAEQFHGDGGDTDVDVVLADGLLKDRIVPSIGDELGDAAFLVGGVRLPILFSQGSGEQISLIAGHSSDGLVSGADLGGSFACGHARPLPALSSAPVGAVSGTQESGAHGGLSHAEALSYLGLADTFEVEPDGLSVPWDIGAITELSGLLDGAHDAELLQSLVGGGGTNADIASDGGNLLASEVSVTEIADIEVRDFDGHVYNLETGGGWYAASSIVVHNCRHSLSIYLPGVTEAPTRTADPEGDKLRQRQRAYERRIREWKRRVAMDESTLGKDDPRTKADRKRLRTAQAEFKAWREANNRKNLSRRTNITVR